MTEIAPDSALALTVIVGDWRRGQAGRRARVAKVRLTELINQAARLYFLFGSAETEMTPPGRTGEGEEGEGPAAPRHPCSHYSRE